MFWKLKPSAHWNLVVKSEEGLIITYLLYGVKSELCTFSTTSYCELMCSLSGPFWVRQAQREVVKIKNLDFSYWASSTPWGHVLILKCFAEILSWAEQSGTQFFIRSNLLLVSSSRFFILTLPSVLVWLKMGPLSGEFWVSQPE